MTRLVLDTTEWRIAQSYANTRAEALANMVEFLLSGLPDCIAVKEVDGKEIHCMTLAVIPKMSKA